MILESQFTYLREYLPTLSIDERKAYCKDLGDIFEEIISDPNIFLDERDYSLYMVITIGNQTWMVENLRYDIEDSWLNPKNHSIEYGRLYTWDAAMKAAPKGWHLPSDKEWTILQDSIGGSAIETKMKSLTDWNNNGNGNNASGFNAFPAGYYYSGSFYCLGVLANFWSSTVHSGTSAWKRSLVLGNTGVYRNHYNKTDGYSCRYVKNIVN